LGEKGFQDIAEIEVTGHRVVAVRFPRFGFPGGRGAAPPPAPEPDVNMILPQMRHYENDAWPGITFSTAASGYSMAISAGYDKGTFYALAVPDDFADLYRLPENALNQMRGLFGQELFVNLEAPARVSLFAYDNRTFIIQNYQSQPVNARALVVGAKGLRDLLTDQLTAPSPQNGPAGGAFRGFSRGNFGGNNGTPFELKVAAHSFRVFRAE
jgi:hypothetical protein